MMRRRKLVRVRLYPLVVALALGGMVACSMVACGGGGGGGGSAPYLSALTYDPGSAYVNAGGGLLDVSTRIDFSDPDGDLSTLTLTILDSSGGVVSSEVYGIGGAAGIREGWLDGMLTVSTTTADDYTIQTYLTDAAGRRSNTWVDLFRITEYPWAALTPMPTPRFRFSTALVNGLIYAIGGGLKLEDPVPDPRVPLVEIYDPATDTWAAGPPMLIGLASQMTAVVNGKIYAIGGKLNAEMPDEASDVVQVYDPATLTWTTRTPMPTRRYGGAIAVHDGLIYVAAGLGLGRDRLDSLLWYDPVADVWSAGPPMNQARNVAGGGANVDGKILVYGGVNELFGGFLSTLESFDPVLGVWSNRADGEPRHDTGIAVVDGLMYTFAGGNGDGQPLDSVRVYDNATDQWATKTSMPVAQTGVRTAVVGDRVYAFGSYDTLEYTPSNDLK